MERMRANTGPSPTPFRPAILCPPSFDSNPDNHDLVVSGGALRVILRANKTSNGLSSTVPALGIRLGRGAATMYPHSMRDASKLHATLPIALRGRPSGRRRARRPPHDERSRHRSNKRYRRRPAALPRVRPCGTRVLTCRASPFRASGSGIRDGARSIWSSSVRHLISINDFRRSGLCAAASRIERQCAVTEQKRALARTQRWRPANDLRLFFPGETAFRTAR